jgi:hypothetical protein
MGVENGRSGRDLARADEVDQRGHRFALIDGVGDHPLELRAATDRLERLTVGNLLAPRVPAVE